MPKKIGYAVRVTDEGKRIELSKSKTMGFTRPQAQSKVNKFRKFNRTLSDLPRPQRRKLQFGNPKIVKFRP